MPKKRSTRSLDPALGQIYERVNPKLDERERLQELFRILLEEKIASLGDDVPESHKKAAREVVALATPSLKQTINTIYADADGDALMNDKDISNVRDSHAKMATSLEQTRKELGNMLEMIDQMEELRKTTEEYLDNHVFPAVSRAEFKDFPDDKDPAELVKGLTRTR